MTISGYKKGSDKLPKANERIDASEVRVIDESGKMLGVMPTRQAIALAASRQLDLVEVAENDDDVPVCKILDFGKFKFDRQRKDHKNRKKQKIVQIKEIKLRPGIGEHDYQVKLKSGLRFLEEGDKVKVTLRFRGREVTHQEIGEALMVRFIEDTKELGKVESPVRAEGKQLVMVVASLR